MNEADLPVGRYNARPFALDLLYLDRTPARNPRKRRKLVSWSAAHEDPLRAGDDGCGGERCWERREDHQADYGENHQPRRKATPRPNCPACHGEQPRGSFSLVARHEHWTWRRSAKEWSG